MKALFFSGSFQQSAYWAEQLGFSRNEWTHLTPLTVRGRMEPTVYLVGTWYEHPNRDEILAALEPTKARLICGEQMVESAGEWAFQKLLGNRGD